MSNPMLDAFDAQAEDICSRRDSFRVSAPAVVVGLESEIALFSDEIEPRDISQLREEMIRENGELAHELGATQLEFRTSPVDILDRGIGALQEELAGKYEQIRRQAVARDLFILRIGANPFYPILGAPRTDKPRYQLVPDFQNVNRRAGMDTTIGMNGTRVDVGDAASVSLFQALHVNLQADSIPDAVDKLNRSLMVSPYVLAAAGNSRYLNLTDTGLNEARMVVWELSHDTRTPEELRQGVGLRIGLPENYFGNLRAYFNRMRRYPFILDDPAKAFGIATGLSWLDARIKFIGNHAVVELRSLPTLPTTSQEVAFVSFYLGRLFYSQLSGENLLDIAMVEENRLNAMLYGLQARFWCHADGGVKVLSGTEMFRSELAKAKSGLGEVGLSADALGEIEDWGELGSPSSRLAQNLSGYVQVPHCKMVDALWRTGILDMC